MSWSEEKHAQDWNLIWNILMPLRPNLFVTVYTNTLYICNCHFVYFMDTLIIDNRRGRSESWRGCGWYKKWYLSSSSLLLMEGMTMEFMTCLYPHSRVAAARTSCLICRGWMCWELFQIICCGCSPRCFTTELAVVLVAAWWQMGAGSWWRQRRQGTPSHLDPRHHGYSICTFWYTDEYRLSNMHAIFREGAYRHLFRVKSASAFTCMFCKLASDPILQVRQHV